MLKRQWFSRLFCLVAMGVFVTVGCGPAATPSAPVPAVTETVNDDHDHDHEGHDHEGHDHEGHDHDDHDHEGHDHGDHEGDDHGTHEYATLFDAVDALDELSGEIGAGLTGDDPESAHDALHDIGNVLDATEKLVKESSLEGDAKEAASSAVEELFDAFTSIDEKMHGHEGKDFVEVQDKIESAIKTLQESAK